MSKLTKTIKNLSIPLGFYRPARRLSRILRPKQREDFEADVRFYRSLLPKGALCFDVGANIGYKSEAILQAGARVVAFEPNPMVIPELKARCKGHKRWSLVESALGSQAAIATLYARKIHGQSSLLKEWQGEIVAKYHVPVVTLESAIEAFGRPYYCKIDVEGWEAEVFSGLQQPINLISFEVHLGVTAIPKTLACLQRLAQLGTGTVNLTPAEKAHFHLSEWVPLAEFIEWYPGDLRKTLPGHKYGDLFIRMDVNP